jgi:ABC-type polysaccharide/polyol phosphate transport system ATPase subunit
MAAIEVRGITKTFEIPHERRTTFKEVFLHPLRRTTYEQNEALKDVTFSIEAGEFFGIVGPNGSGKSTLLRIIAGIYRPDRGSVQVRGQLSPFIELTARENIIINGTLLGLTRRELQAKFDDILEFAELERFVDQKLKNYSSGMLVRLAFSLAIQAPFDVLLLDEVLAVGDHAFQEKCFRSFEQMRDDRRTVVIVSHDLDAVGRFCDRALLLQHGAVAEVGRTDDVIAAYVSKDAATA